MCPRCESDKVFRVDEDRNTFYCENCGNFYEEVYDTRVHLF